MELIRGIHNLRSRHRGCAVTIGAFDGVHRGHRSVLAHLKHKAAALGLPTAVISFEPLPREYFNPEEAPPRIMSFRERTLALAAEGVDRNLVLRFDAALQSMSAEAFLKRVFVDGLGARYIVLGDDFRFGHSREGDLAFLAQQAALHGYEARPTSTVTEAGERISSTRVRDALARGDVTEAEQLLGRPFRLTGRVVKGRQLGRQLGTPTANVALHRRRTPVAGVFAVTVTGAGLDAAPAVANVGVRPTVAETTRANLEVHLLDRTVDLYGERIEVCFHHKLRDEKTFASLDALRAAIDADKAAARAWHGLGEHETADSQ